MAQDDNDDTRPSGPAGRTWPDIAYILLYAKSVKFVLLTVAVVAGLLATGVDAGGLQWLAGSVAVMALALFALVALWPQGANLLAKPFRRLAGRGEAREVLRRAYKYEQVEPASWGLAVKLRCPNHRFMANGHLWRAPDQRPERYPHLEYLLRDIRNLKAGTARLQLYTRSTQTDEIDEQLFLLFKFDTKGVVVEIGDDMPPEGRKPLFDRVTSRFSQLEGVSEDGPHVG